MAVVEGLQAHYGSGLEAENIKVVEGLEVDYDSVGSISRGSVSGRLKFEDCEGNVIDCFKLGIKGKKILLDVDSIQAISGDADFILFIENASTDNWLDEVPFYDFYRCIIVTTTGGPLDDTTKKFLCKLQRILHLKMFALLDFIPRSVDTILDLTCEGLSIIWLGIRPTDVCHLIEMGIQMEPLKDFNCGELVDRIRFTLRHSNLIDGFYLMEQLHTMLVIGLQVSVKTLPYRYLIRSYLPQKLETFGIRGL